MHTRLRPLVPALAIFFVCLGIYLPTASRHVTSTDVYGANLASWQIATTGNPWFEELAPDQYAENPLPGHQWAGTVDNGHQVITRSPGVVAAAVPAYWLDQSDDFGIGPGGWTAALLSAITAVLIFLTFSSRLTRLQAAVASGAFAFATPMWSAAADGMWTHTVTTLGIGGMAWAATKERWWLVGTFGGVALFGRFHVSLVAAILGVGIALSRRRPDIAMKVAATSSLFMALAMIWTRWMYGTWSPMGGYGSGYLERLDGFEPTWTSRLANFAGMWVSPDRGFFVWTPLALLLLPALIRGWRELPDWTQWLAWGGLTYTLAQSWISGFFGGDAYYGYRLSSSSWSASPPPTPSQLIGWGHGREQLWGR